MVFKTNFSEDILNTIFEFAGIIPKYEYYKRSKNSQIGYKNIKLAYKCLLCDKKLRNIKSNGVYGFCIEYYEYYEITLPNTSFRKEGISRFYHSKRKPDDNKLYDIIRNLPGDVTEGAYNFSITLRNTMDGKILGKLLIDTFTYITNLFNKINRDKRKIERCGIEIEIKMDSKGKILNGIKKDLLDSNDISVGYCCKKCSNNRKYYNFIKL